MYRANNRRARRRKGMDRVTTIVLAAFLLVAGATAVVAFIWVRNMAASWTQSAVPGVPVVAGSQNSGGLAGANGGKGVTAPTGPLQTATGPTAVPWDGSSRVTVLVMGVDYRDWEQGMDVPRTDSMILVSIDPASKTAGILSIPRDLWINIPGMGFNKINTAYRWGEIYKLPGGGPGLAMKTVEQFLGVPVNYYALINFDAFVKFIDELGGLDMKIRQEIEIDPIGPGNTKILKPGTQTLTGAEVLAYARQRYSAGSDFDRSARQQEVIMAIRKQVLQFHMLPTLVAKSPKLYQEIASGISTNLTLNQVIRLALLGSQIDEKSIKKGVIAPPVQVELGKSPDGLQDIVIPVPDQIRLLRDTVFSTSNPASASGTSTVPEGAAETIPSITTAPTAVENPADLARLMRAEKARVVIMNGTNSAGLASKTSDLLKGLGVNIISEDNADQVTDTTTIKDFTGKPNTTRFLTQTLHIPASRVTNSYDPQPQADIEIILGADWASQQH